MAKVKVGKVWTKRKEAPEAVQTETKQTEVEAKQETVTERTKPKESWIKRNGKFIVGSVTTIAGIAATVFFGKKIKQFNDEWNQGQDELQQRFPDGKITLTDVDGNELECERMATYGGKHGPSEFLFWAEVPEQTDNEET